MELTLHSFYLVSAMALVASLYASVGHGGASGYLAVMALAGFLPTEMRPTALALNLVTSSVASWMFWRAGHFSWRLFLPVAVTSIPMAFLGGRWTVPSPIFHFVLAFCLAAAAVSLVVTINPPSTALKEPSLIFCLLAGALIGLLSGLVGVGGGIFLTPLMLLARWCPPKTASAVSALFILVNSTAGLCGNSHALSHISVYFPWFVVAVLVAGSVGAFWGSGIVTNLRIRQVLAVVLFIAAAKMIVTI